MKILKLLIPIILICGLMACHRKPVASKPINDKPVPVKTVELPRPIKDSINYEALKYTPAKIIDYSEVSGCGFLIELADGKKLEPDSIPPVFRVREKKIWVKFQQQNRMSVCMAGVHVQVLDMKERE